MNAPRLTLQQWVRDRLDNTRRIAATRTGADRDGWLEDGEYWAAILAVVTVTDSAVALAVVRGDRTRFWCGWRKDGGIQTARTLAGASLFGFWREEDIQRTVVRIEAKGYAVELRRVWVGA